MKYLFPTKNCEYRYCETCIFGKETWTHYPISETIYKNAFNFVHSDIWISSVVSRRDFKYFISFIDHKTRYIWVYMLTQKYKHLKYLKILTITPLNNIMQI